MTPSSHGTDADCPSPERLEGFRAGRFDGPDASSIATHLSGCPRCREWLAESAANEAVLDGLRPVMDRLPHDGNGSSSIRIEDPSAAPVDGALPASIRGFSIIGKLGEGGMGVVFEARQLEPPRPVALKVIRGECLSGSKLRLFHREVRALARLRHPAIAAIYASDRTESGAPFFVMELVRGETLMAHMQRASPSLPARLSLFARICEGVGYAHQRGVIHRDLKPSNIVIDPDGAPHILDFGLARIKDADDSSSTAMTEIGHVQGTLAYMSPEQARGQSAEIDVRSDVYSLGVIAYEMVAGQPPYSVKGKPLVQAMRTICEESAARPSAINRSLRGDVETILLKAIQKEPSARYQSVTAMAEDVGPYLANQPILARRPTLSYQLRKLVVRHKLGASVVVALLAAIIGAATWLAVLYERADANYRRAVAAESAAEVEATRATSEAQRATSEAERARRAKDFMVDLFKGADPQRSGVEAVTARQILDRGADRVETELSREPLLQAAMYETIGQGYDRLAVRDRATELFEKALEIRRKIQGPEHADVAGTLLGLGVVRQKWRDFAGATKCFEEALAINRKVLGNQHPATAAALLHAGNQHSRRGETVRAEAEIREAMAIYRLRAPGDDMLIADCLSSLALVARRNKDTPAAQAFFDESLAMRRRLVGNHHVRVAASLLNEGIVHQNHREYADAERVLREALEALPDDANDTQWYRMRIVNELGRALRLLGRFDEAIAMRRQGLEAARRLCGNDSSFVVGVLRALGNDFRAKGDVDGQLRSLKEALDVSRRISGSSEGLVMNQLFLVSRVLMDGNRGAEAMPYVTEAVALLPQRISVKERQTQRILRNVIRTAREHGYDDISKLLLPHLRSVAPATQRAEEPADPDESIDDQTDGRLELGVSPSPTQLEIH